MKMILGMTLFIFSFVSEATVTVGTANCPIQFEGKVKEIIEPVGSSGFFATNKVVFENQATLRGVADEKVIIDVLRDGPFKTEVDHEYRVQLRNGKLCWIEEI